MAKKTKTSKKKSTRGTVGKKRGRAVAKKTGRSTGKARSGKKVATKAVSKRSPAAGTSRTRMAKSTDNSKGARKTAARAGTGPRDAASNRSTATASVAVKTALTEPAARTSSVIRIKTNAKPKRGGRGRTGANSVNHRARSGATPASAQDPIQFPEETRRLPKTHLSAKELREFRLLLLAKRAELCGDVERLTAEAFHHVEEGGNDRSAMPIHMADLGSDNWEQDFTLGLIDTERSLVHEIDEALNRIDNKTYGICLATHNKISLARLRAKPWAKYCIEYARAREEGRAF